MDQFQFESPVPRPARGPSARNPAATGGRRCRTAQASRQPFASAAVRNGPREGAEGREAAVAEAEHGEGECGRSVECVKSVEKALGRGRRIPVAIGRGEHDNAFGARIAGRIEGRHRRGVDRLACRGQCVMQRRGEAPGAAAFAAHEKDRLGTIGPAVAVLWLRAVRAASQSTTPVPPITGTPSAISPSTSPRQRRPVRCAACRSFRTHAPSSSGRPR